MRKLVVFDFVTDQTNSNKFQHHIVHTGVPHRMYDWLNVRVAKYRYKTGISQHVILEVICNTYVPFKLQPNYH